MKQKISITVDEKMLEAVNALLDEDLSVFRNRSHVIEYSLKKLIKEKNENVKNQGGLK